MDTVLGSHYHKTLIVSHLRMTLLLLEVKTIFGTGQIPSPAGKTLFWIVEHFRGEHSSTLLSMASGRGAVHQLYRTSS